MPASTLARLLPAHLLGVLLCLPRTAAAERLSIELLTFGEAAPGRLCVVAEHMAGGTPLTYKEAMEPGLRWTGVERSACVSDGQGHGDARCTPVLVEEALKPPTTEDRTPAVPAPGATMGTQSGPPSATKGSPDTPEYRYRCTDNRFGGPEDLVAVLLVQDALVSDFELSQSVANLALQRPKVAETHRATATVRLIGGSYQAYSPILYDLAEERRFVELPLVPLCVRRHVEEPNFICEEQGVGANRGKLTRDGYAEPTSTQETADGAEFCVVLHETPKKISATACKGQKDRQKEHAFSAGWSGALPPETITLRPTQLWFRWKSNCLYPVQECPTVRWLAENISCRPTGSTRTVVHDPNASGGAGFCTYAFACEDGGRFPAKLELSVPNSEVESVNQSWQETLTYPGETLEGYLPPERRRVRLDWKWKPTPQDPGERGACPAGSARPSQSAPSNRPRTGTKRDASPAERARCARQRRAEWPGEEIDWVALRTPAGTMHRVHIGANHLSIPELDCEDVVSYQYLGTREYEEHVATDSTTGVTLADPDDVRASAVSLGVAVGGGVRMLPHLPNHWVGPQGEVAVILTFTEASWRSEWFLLPWLKTRNTVQLELRLAGTMAAQPYCAHYGSGSRCADGDWELIPYWRFPLDLGAQWFFEKRFRFSAGAGVALGSFTWWRDNERVPMRGLGTARTAVGFGITKAFSVEAQGRAYLGEQVNRTNFDAAGTVSYGMNDHASRWSFTTGLLLRLDNVL